MKQTILGIDIGSYSIKIAEIERSFKSFDFVNFYERKIQYNELLKTEESISVTLQGMIDDFGLKWDHVIVGYPGEKVSSRFVTLPFGNLKKIDQTLEFELEGFIPFDLENLVIDYYAVELTKESSDILVFYTLKNDFESWLAFLQNSRIDPKIITVEEIEYLNLVTLGMTPPEGPYAIIDIGHTKTNVTVCNGKKLAFTRSIAKGGKDFTDALQKKMNVPQEEAERLKIEIGSIPAEDEEIMDDLSRQVGETMRGILDELLVNLRQVMFAFRSQFREPIGGIYLCGGSSRIPGLDRYVSSQLKQNVTFIDPSTFHFNQLGKVASHNLVMPQGLALALRGMASAGMPNINLRQGEYAFKGDIAKISGTFRHVGVALGLIFVLGLGYFGVKYFALKKQVENVNMQVLSVAKSLFTEEEMKKIESPAAALKRIQNKKKEMEKLTESLSEVQGDMMIDLLKEVSQKVPKREAITLDVDQLEIKGESLSMKGVVDSFVSVDKIKAALEDSKYFTEASSGPTRKGIREGEYKFDVKVMLQSKAKKEKSKAKGKRKRKKKT